MVENMYLIEKLIFSQEELHLGPRKTSNKQESVDNQYGEWWKKNLKQFKGLKAPEMSERTRNKKETLALAPLEKD